VTLIQGDHSPDNVKFSDGSWHSACYVLLNIMTVLVLVTVSDWHATIHDLKPYI